LVEKEHQIVQLKKEKYQLNDNRQYYKTRTEDLEIRLDLVTEAHNHLFERANLRPGLRNISHIGGYSAALKSSVGYASSEATVLMVLGDPHVGQFTSKNIVTNYQHKAANAQRVRSKKIFEWIEREVSATPQDALVTVVNDTFSLESWEVSSYEVYGVSCDASNTEALDKSSVHVALVSISAIGRASLAECIVSAGDVQIDDDHMERVTASSRQLCDIQKCPRKTGEEMYAMLLREFHSISWKDWESRANNSHLRTHQQSTYAYGLDKGPDCQKCCRLTKQRLKGIPSVSMLAVFCFSHRNDHIGQSQLALLNKWDWEPTQKDELGSVKYTSSLAIFTNTWRGSGVPAKLEESAAKLYDDSVAVKCFRSKPGRLIKTRWLSSDSIEDKIIKCQDYLGPVFNDVFEGAMTKHREAQAKAQAQPKKAAATAKPKPKPKPKSSSNNQVDHEADMEEDFSIKQHRYRVTACLLSTSNLWYATVRISRVAKSQQNIFVKWAQKHTKMQNDAVAACSDDGGRTYLGPTPLSEFVRWKAQDMSSKMVALMDDSSFTSPLLWKPVFDIIPQEFTSNACALIISLSLRNLAGWEKRVMADCQDVPLLLLRCLESPCHHDCNIRRSVAIHILSLRECCLMGRYYEDFSFKILQRWRSAFERMRESGVCHPELYVHLLLVRSRLRLDNQALEGFMSTLKHLTDLSRNMGHATANARMALKLGEPITPEECVDLHKEVTAFMRSHVNASRFMDVDLTSAPRLESAPVCFHLVTPVQARLHAYALDIKNCCQFNAKWCYTCTTSQATALDTFNEAVQGIIIVWSYFSTVYCYVGRIIKTAAVPTFFLQRPVQPLTLDSWLASVGFHVMQEPRPRLYLNEYRVRWSYPAVINGPIDMITLKSFNLDGKPRKRNSIARGVDPSGPAALADGSADQLADADFWELLGQIAEEGQAEADGEESSLECSEAGSEHGSNDDEEHAPGPAPPAPGPAPPGPPAPFPPPRREVPFSLIAAEDDRERVALGIINFCYERVQAYKAAVLQADAQAQQLAPRAVALVKTDDRVTFVAFTQPETFQAFIVDIDESNKAISQCHYNPSADFQGCSILVHQVPVVYNHRFAKHLRPDIPHWCMLIFMVEQANLSSGPYTITKHTVNRFSCVRCACIKDLEVSARPLREAEPSIFLCRSCGSAWHEECIYDSCQDANLDEFKCFGCS
jgi:hypothetical protein